MSFKEPIRIPNFLKPGDTIGIAATARLILGDELKNALDIFHSWNLKVELAPNIGVGLNQFAGTDKERALGFQHLLDNPEVKAIFIARGGYGTARAIDLIDFSRFEKDPIWICGYSDITVLHGHLNKNYNCASLHCNMPMGFPKEREHWANTTIMKALFQGHCDIQSAPESLNIFGKCKGVVVGGNLSVLYSIRDTQSYPLTDDSVLFIEDLDEYLYHIDRMMVGLKRAGALNKLKGILVGGMTDMRDNEIPFGKTAKEIVHEHSVSLGIPVAFGIPIGHQEDNRALILNRRMELEVGMYGATLNFL